MASNGASTAASDTENSLERIKRQLASGFHRNLLQGPFLKRSETLRKWNDRWVILDPTTGRMEYKMRKNESTVKADSSGGGVTELWISNPSASHAFVKSVTLIPSK
ncbi:Pleckstrin-like (PH) domain protein [Quillaja saponaria]|uniref:Pleckstrin-like (PH) domain protein n=1 Tax=Quillaja saponaria TaxID=32244 RepID=A0AAD7PJX5_QUISA|nr:Pleckstrin-like (PH) domain protein [Quillaja saponaria]